MTKPTEQTKVAVVGLGYVGEPLARLFATRYPTTGYDYNKAKAQRCAGEGLPRKLTVTADEALLEGHDVYVVAVPTPVGQDNEPDLECLISATRTVGKRMGRGAVVVYESTVYPGLTEEVCAPLLAMASGMKYNEDFFVGFSPERVNPGDKQHTVERIVKVTSGSTPEAADFIDSLYASVLACGTFRAKDIRTAEASKIMENCQRDVLLAFFNEMRMTFDSLGIDIRDVTEAASTKWNFVSLKPGLVGGHCIAVDPYYLISRARRNGMAMPLLTAARRDNEQMPHWMARQIIERIDQEEPRQGIVRALVMGFAFKPDCDDIRNTKAIALVADLRAAGYDVTIYDPHVDAAKAKATYGISVATDKGVLTPEGYDIVVTCTPHSAFKLIDTMALTATGGIVCDVYGITKKKKAPCAMRPVAKAKNAK